MATSTTQYMFLVLPVPTSEPGPDYAYEINNAMTLVDQHDHSPTRGTPVTPAGLNINADLAFNNNNATNLRSTRFQTQSSPISLSTDIGCLYVSGVDLYYNDRNSNQIRITQSGSISGTAGSITGLLPPASVVYTAGNSTFTFQSSTAQAANIDAGSYTFREVIANANGITISSPASLGTNYTLILPRGLPAAGMNFLTVDSSGNLFDDTHVDNSTIIISSSALQVAPNAPFSGAVKSANQFVVTSSLAVPSSGLMIIQGSVNANGSSAFGYGFTSSGAGGGGFTVNFHNFFADKPIITATNTDGNARFPSLSSFSSSAFTLNMFDVGGTGLDTGFSFIAIGRRR